MALDVLQWTNKRREDVNFVLEGKLMFSQATEGGGRRPWNTKMTPVSALLVTLGRNSLEPPSSLQDDGSLHFPVETGVTEAALLLIKEKNNRYSMIRVKLANLLKLHEKGGPKKFFLSAGSHLSGPLRHLLGTRMG